DMKDMGGLSRAMPQTAIVFLIGTLSLAGVPLFAGFASKEEVLGAVWSGGFTVPFFMLLFAAFLTAFYMFRVVFLVFFAEGDARREARGAAAAAAAATPAAPLPPRGSHLPHRASHIEHPHAHDGPAVMTLPLWVLAI